MEDRAKQYKKALPNQKDAHYSVLFFLDKDEQQPSNATSKFINKWSAQCQECLKWRVFPTQEDYEEIRSKFLDDPFVCSKKKGIRCEDPADIEYDNSRTWVIDKPNLPKTPKGFNRKLVVRKDFSKVDCYYDFPLKRKKFRSTTELAKFLDGNFDCVRKDISILDFSFCTPKVMVDTVPARMESQ